MQSNRNTKRKGWSMLSLVKRMKVITMAYTLPIRLTKVWVGVGIESDGHRH